MVLGRSLSGIDGFVFGYVGSDQNLGGDRPTCVIEVCWCELTHRLFEDRAGPGWGLHIDMVYMPAFWGDFLLA